MDFFEKNLNFFSQKSEIFSKNLNFFQKIWTFFKKIWTFWKKYETFSKKRKLFEKIWNDFENFEMFLKNFRAKFWNLFSIKSFQYFCLIFFLNRFRISWKIQKWRLEVPRMQRGRVSERNVEVRAPTCVVSFFPEMAVLGEHFEKLHFQKSTWK